MFRELLPTLAVVVALLFVGWLVSRWLDRRNAKREIERRILGK